MGVTSWIAWTLLHFVWQGTVIALAAALALRALRDGEASRRYIAGVTGLVLMAVVPATTLVRLRSAEASTVAEPAQEPPTTGMKAAPRSLRSTLVSDDVNRTGSGMSAPPELGVPRFVLASLNQRLETLQQWGDSVAPGLVRIWLVGVFLFSLRLLAGWLGIRRLVRVGVETPNALLSERFSEVARRMEASSTVRLIESAILRTPAAIGFFRPILLWPVSLHTGLTVTQIDLLLAHELAHLKRHDYLINLMQTCLETALFYHPGVWWLSKRVRYERELCCDDVATRVAGDPRDYAAALLALESWRQELPVLAAGATGGSLLARIERLVASAPSPASRGPRWAALPLALAALTGILVTAHQAPAGPTSIAANATLGQDPRRPAGKSKPSSVTRYPGSGSLDARMNWASKEAADKGFTHYWIGYTVAADPLRRFLYIDHATPASTASGSVSMGRMRFKRADHVTFPGVPLESVLGDQTPDATVILLGFSSDKPGVAERLHASSSAIAIHFDGRPLLWLDQVSDVESVAAIQNAFSQSTNEESREDLIAMLGAHTDGPLVFSALRVLFDSSDADRLRAAIVNELGDLAAAPATAFLEGVARSDRSMQVRREAAESLGQQPDPTATAVLGRLARSTRDLDTARRAAESLGERKAPEAFDELVSLAWSTDLATEVRREAVESMGRFNSLRASAELQRIARTHPEDEIRREAIERLGELKDSAGTLDLLEHASKDDPSESVRKEAVESLANVGTERTIKFLTTLAQTNDRTEARRRSVETLIERGHVNEAFAAIDSMIKSNDLRAAREATEILGDVESDLAVARLSLLVYKDQRPEIQRACADALGNATSLRSAFVALREIAANHPNEEVQRQAVESIGRMEVNGVTAALDEIARTHPSERVRIAAVDSFNLDLSSGRASLKRLAEDGSTERIREAAIQASARNGLSDAATDWMTRMFERESPRRVQIALLDAMSGSPRSVELLIAIARKHQDPKVREHALDLLARSSDPRAKKEAARLR